jgi:hypothetical protein
MMELWKQYKKTKIPSSGWNILSGSAAGLAGAFIADAAKEGKCFSDTRRTRIAIAIPICLAFSSFCIIASALRRQAEDKELQQSVINQHEHSLNKMV